MSCALAVAEWPVKVATRGVGDASTAGCQPSVANGFIRTRPTCALSIVAEVVEKERLLVDQKQLACDAIVTKILENAGKVAEIRVEQ